MKLQDLNDKLSKSQEPNDEKLLEVAPLPATWNWPFLQIRLDDLFGPFVFFFQVTLLIPKENVVARLEVKAHSLVKFRYCEKAKHPPLKK